MCKEDVNFWYLQMNMYSFVEIKNTERCLLFYTYWVSDVTL